MRVESTPLHRDDLSLAASILAGSEAAFQRFYHDAFPRLFRFALRHCGNAATAEEVTQETLVAALERLGSYRGEASLLTWLFSIARHGLLRCGAQDARLARFEDDAGLESLLQSALGPEQEDPAGAVMRDEIVTRVHSVLDRLPPLYADCLEGKYVLGLSVRELALRQNRSEKSVESTLTRSREAFRAGFLGGWEAEIA